MLNSKESIEDVLRTDRFNDEQKRKIELSQEVRVYAFEKLGLKKTKNYSQFVDLKRRYITYAVTASQRWRLEPHLWNFPIIGKAPYKSFYNEDLAKKEAEELKQQNLDVSIRGISAYSTLGKLTDPLLSSMLNYSDHDLVNTIIHELVHTTLFIKDNIDFNERLAVFIANKGTALFYSDKEGSDSKTLKLIQNENYDDELFSKFITSELKELKNWYEKFDHSKKLPEDDKEIIRQERLKLISIHFENDLKPKLKSGNYANVFSKKFNNADLGVYNTYMKSLSTFETVFQKYGANISIFLKKCEELENFDNPESILEKWAKED